MRPNNKILALVLVLTCSLLFGQNSNPAKKWYFGSYAGLDFTTNPPTALTNGSMQAYYSCSSIADNNANLLFYTDGSTVWDASHNVMANGSGLSGSAGYYGQTVLIVKQPGANSFYYIFHVDPQNCQNCNGTLYYSVVDMSLATGSGSVITKNVAIYTGSVTGKVTATRHCNGTDVWIVNKDSYGWWGSSSTTSGTFTPNFRSYLLTSAGLNTTAVVSAAASITFTNNWGYYDYYGCIKLSPNGKKLGSANYNNNWNWGNNTNPFELYDFDNSTGVVSNSLILATNTASNSGGWSCEFSPDGTKFYGSSWFWTGSAYNGYISQWDMCAGSPTAVAASQVSVSTTTNWGGTMQLAPDGKIYVSSNNWNAQSLDVITAPNQLGSASGYSVQLQSTSPKNTWYSLPNMMTSYLIQRPPPTPFTYTANIALYGCYTASFNTVYSPTTIIGCAASGYSLSSVKWIFGDPASGAANTSTLQNPQHVFTNMGTYSVSLILYYTCGGGTDTLKQLVNITQPCISVNSTSITCANLGSATVQALGSPGPFSYTWMPTNQTNSVATGLSPGSYTITVYDFSNNFSYTAQTIFTSLIPLTGNINISTSVSCFGAATGTGNVTNIAGGSGTENYIWTNGPLTYTSPAPNNLSAGVWTVDVTDALTGCSINQVYLITQPPAMNLVLSSNTPTTCVTRTIALSGTNSGGTPRLVGAPYSYTWTGGPVSNSQVIVQSLPGTYVYTLSSRDSLNCIISKTIAVDYIPNPAVAVSNVSICPLEVGTLQALGASTYTWNGLTTGSTYSASPPASTSYTVIGSALSCTNAAVGTIFIKPLPSPFTLGTTTRCQGDALSLAAYGGSSYVWTGPAGYNSATQNVTINPVGLIHAGVYQATVTAANSCTAPVSTTVTINPTPTLSASGTTVCSNQVLNLSASSFAGSTFLWKGPQNFTANVQNPSISFPSVLYTGNYTVVVTSPATCTNVTTTQASVTALPNPLITSNGTVCLNGTLNFLASGTSGGTLSWIGPAGFSSSNASTLISSAQLSASGFYTLNVVLGPCFASTSKFALVHPLPSFTMSSDNPCETKDLHLSAGGINNAASFSWQGPTPYTSPLQNPVFTNANQSHAGVYTLTVLDQNGCLNSATHTVSIRTNPTLTPVSTTVCLNEPAVLSVSGAQSYVWTGPGSYVSYQANAQILSANNPATLTYTVMGTAANQCTAITTANLSTFELPVPSIAVLPTNRFCLNSVVQLSGQGGRNYDWTGPNGLVFAGQTVTFVAQSEQYQGTYTLTVTDQNKCKGSTSAAIQLDPLPQGGLVGTKMSGCVPFHSDFNFYSTSATAAQIKTQWQLGTGVFNGKSFSADFTAPGQYTINGYLQDTVNFCVKTETFVIDAFGQPSADFSYSPEHPVENTEPVIFTNTSPSTNIKSLKWYFFNNSGPEFASNEVSYFFRDAGEYPVVLMIEDVNGCLDTVMKSVKIDTDFSIYVPNAFTPNDDNLNDQFFPVLHGVKYYEVTVFDRWGHRVFSSTDPKEGWDGKTGGEPCKQGVYVWKIKLSTMNGTENSYEGHVTLYR